MQEQREPVRYSWEGDLPGREVPDQPLYNVELRMRHGLGAKEAAHRIAGLLEPQAGAPKVSVLPLLGAKVRFGDRLLLVAVPTDGELSIRLGQRAKGKVLGRLVAALAQLPGARDLSIEAERSTFAAPYSDRGPCTPCAAKSFPR